MDRLTKEARSRNISRIKAINTLPEIRLRRYLYNLGYRYRIHYPIEGKPDLVFLKKKIAVFIHGCFWHQHGCNNSVIPKSNTDFWMKKLNGNIKRDITVMDTLMKLGWRPVTIWECKIEKGIEHAVQELEGYFGEEHN